MDAYSVERWSDMMVGMLGAAGALTGLLFVGMSVNIEKMLKLAGVPEHGIGALTLLGGVLISTILVLTPQSSSALGVELVLLGAVQFLLQLYVQRLRYVRIGVEYRGAPFFFSAALDEIPALFTIIAGAGLVTSEGGGLYWLAAAFVVAVLAVIVDSWVLLVEILR